MASPISHGRWQHAQACQLRYQRRKERALAGRAAALESSAAAHSREVYALLERHGALRDGVVVEVGSGAHGLIWRWPGRATVRFAIDPLASYYRGAFAALQDGEVTSIEARGEEIPLGDAVADLVLSDNVVDHAADPARFLGECRRIMKRDARLFFTVDTHHRVWHWSSLAYNRLHDAGLRLEVPAFPDHPFHFTRPAVERLVERAGLGVLWSQSHPPPRVRVGRSRPYDVLKHAFFKNARLEMILERR